jgi:hypothetical protein
MSTGPNWAEVGSFFVALAGLASIIVGIRALYQTNKQNAFSNVVACEEMMIAARARFSEALAEQVLANTDAGGHPGLVAARRGLADKKVDESLESYLNTVDRLCAALDRANIPEDVYRSDYRPLINDTMTSFKHKLGPGTVHRHIVKIHGEWADK